MVRIPTDRVPTHPGVMLLEEFLNSLNLTQRELATAIHVPCQWVNELVNGRRGITPSTSLAPGETFQCVGRVLAESPASLGSISCHPVRGRGTGDDFAT